MASITPELIESLLHMSESEILDFKRDQYPFAGADDVQKSELVKDIVAFANAWKTTDAHILIGVGDNPGHRATVVGVTHHIDDALLQQLVNKKTNVPIDFAYIATRIDNLDVGAIQIKAQQARPIYITKKFGKLDPDTVYIRRGSSTDVAKPTEVSKMGASTLAADLPEMAVNWYDVHGRKNIPSPATVVCRLLPMRQRTIQDDILAMKLAATVGPSPEAIAEYERARALLRPVTVSVLNSGRAVARDVRIRMTVPKLPDLKVTDRPPRKPVSPFERALGRADLSLSDTNISEAECPTIINLSLGKIQAGAEVLSDPFWIGSVKPQVVPFAVQVFCDELSAPIDVELSLSIVPRIGSIAPEE